MFSIFEDETMGNSSSGTLTFTGMFMASTRIAEGVMEIHIRGNLTRNGLNVRSIKVERYNMQARVCGYKIVLNWNCRPVSDVALTLRRSIEQEIADSGTTHIGTITESGCRISMGASASASVNQPNNNQANNNQANIYKTTDPPPDGKTWDEWLEENWSTVAMGSLLLVIVLRR